MAIKAELHELVVKIRLTLIGRSLKNRAAALSLEWRQRLSIVQLVAQSFTELVSLTPNFSHIQSLIRQFQTRYPSGSLIAELLTIHEGSYVVRALVQTGGTTLATGMATAADIEAAEDRAKVRALTALGLETTTVAPSPVLSLVDPLADPLPSVSKPAHLKGTKPSELATDFSASTPASTTAINGGGIEPMAEPAIVTPAPAPTTRPSPSTASSLTDWDAPTPFSSNASPASPSYSAPQDDLFSTSYMEPPPEVGGYEEPDLAEVNFDPPPFEREAVPQPPVAGVGEKPSRRRSTVKKSSVAEEPDDRSDELAKIWVEMKRLGWTKEQGRDYLKQTYGKRSRQELDDEELVDFLRYLESQPSSSDSFM